DLHVVLRNTDLLRNIDRHFFQRVPIADLVDERHQNMEPRAERLAVPPEAFDDIGALLRHDDSGLYDDHYEQDEEEYRYGQEATRHVFLLRKELRIFFVGHEERQSV